MIPITPGHTDGVPRVTLLNVLLDGRVIGSCSPQTCKKLAQQLRYMKVNGQEAVPLDLEIGSVPVSRGGQYPGALFLMLDLRGCACAVKSCPISFFHSHRAIP